VLPDPIEAHVLGELDVLLERLVVGRRRAGLVPVPLIQDESQRIGSVVEHDAIALDADGPQRGVARNAVEHHPLERQFQRGVDERRGLRAPQQRIAVVVYSRIRQRDTAMYLAVDDGVPVVCQWLAAVLEPKTEGDLRARAPADHHVHRNFPALEVCRPTEVLDPVNRDDLQPDGLPDAAGARIPDRVRLQVPVLFPARFR
jgi:hypothetical protein